jgi:hypothetical protein
VLRDTGSERIEPADGGVEVGLSGNDWTGFLRVAYEPVEGAGPSRCYRNIRAVRPERERTLQQGERTDGTSRRPSILRTRQHGGNDDTAEAVPDEVETQKRTSSDAASCKL